MVSFIFHSFAFPSTITSTLCIPSEPMLLFIMLLHPTPSRSFTVLPRYSQLICSVVHTAPGCRAALPSASADTQSNWRKHRVLSSQDLHRALQRRILALSSFAETRRDAHALSWVQIPLAFPSMCISTPPICVRQHSSWHPIRASASPSVSLPTPPR
ncbi:hypothetical protein B0H11DRAFT_542485 [Mycena galericulata]|nr:hypothetical protein B0H11DRAFT_542485 [Mycena galericulata]